MAGAYFVREDGPLAGSTISFTEGTEWILGRDPDLSTVILEDPMASRKHARLFQEDNGYYLENLSKVNPLQINGLPVVDVALLQEQDEIQIGNSIFRFTTKEPREPPLIEEEPLSITEKRADFLPFFREKESRFLLKVVSGPNQGAEFGMDPGTTYIIGKDPHTADIIFQDLSVSREHAKLQISASNEVTIEDLHSRNGTMVNGVKIDAVKALYSQDLLSMGTTSFLLLDKEAVQETIYSPTHVPQREEALLPKTTAERVEEEEPTASWKDTFIPTKHLLLASVFSLLIVFGLISLLTLFKSQTVLVHAPNESEDIRKILSPFKGVQFSYSPTMGTLFLSGHLLTNLEHNELLYLLNNLSFPIKIEDNIIIDEGVWESMNALLSQNSNWRTVMITSAEPGRFVLRGFLQTEEEASALQAYLNLYFPYQNLLDNQVIVEDTLHTQVQTLLLKEGFMSVTFQLTGGDLLLAGRVPDTEEKKFRALLEVLGDVPGIRQVKNFVIFSTISTARIDLTSQYQVTGTTKLGSVSLYVVINGKILSQGDMLDGMLITAISPKEISLEKEGMKYKIDYNQQ